MIETRTLFPGVTLRICRDTRFKQGCLSFQLVRQMKKEEAALNALLPSVLLRGTRSCPDLRSITEHLDELYGASVSPLVRRVGDYQTTGVYCGFMDDRFALPGDQVLRPMLGFLEEILLESPLENGSFLPSFVESEKKNLISTIESERNDKRTYSMNRLLRIMCREDTFGLPRLGETEQVAAITPQSLYDHYRKILRTSPIEIFYVGSAEADRLTELLMPMLSKLQRCCGTLLPQTAFHPCEERDEVETMDVSQGKLCMGFTVPVTNRMPEFAAMQVMNVIYGSGMTSKLFQNVREKMSLCYSIGSGYYGTKGILIVHAGIDFDKEQQTRAEVLRQLDACREGEITPQELKAAKEALLSSLRGTHDSPGAIENFYSTAAMSGLIYSHAEYMRAVEQVTVEAVADCARQVRLHTTYFLKGGSQ
ncbi:MAG: insulinase family protein [Oscillospiraceae bacterium]|nr:insulinase family protein [Oscillospiraceae bacterium]MBQ7130484.1 insulinase family protein [Oscillospiraceae bacterium]